jgi:basic amino acid/polyamine antiporter, APA family
MHTMRAAASPARVIGRWALTGLMINSVIASGVFGVPGELLKLLGRASPWAFVLGGVASAFIVTCFVEVASQFTAGGGPYLYVRTAFGRFLGIQAGWFTLLTPVAAAAAQANLFVNYFASFNEILGGGVPRGLVITALIAVPVTVNLYGAAAGKQLSSVLVIAKLAPLLLLIATGIFFISSGASPPPVHASVESHTLHAWFTAALLGAFGFGGFEDVLAATGEVKQPTRSVAFALVVSLVTCAVIYVLIQWVTSAFLDPATVGRRPLASLAAVLFGSAGGRFVAIAAMISTSGAIAATVLAIPRLIASMAQRGDLPSVLGRTTAKGGAPAITTIILGVVVTLLAITGTFAWTLAVTAGSGLIMAAGVCAALPRLRRLQPQCEKVAVPGGIAIASVALVVIAVLLFQLEAWQAAALLGTAVIGAMNWCLVARR